VRTLEPPCVGSSSRGIGVPSADVPPARPLRGAEAPVGPASPNADSCSALVVSHHLDGFLRAEVAGLLHPATGKGFTAFRVCRQGGGPKATSMPGTVPAVRFAPFEEFPSSAAGHASLRPLPSCRHRPARRVAGRSRSSPTASPPKRGAYARVQPTGPRRGSEEPRGFTGCHVGAPPFRRAVGGRPRRGAGGSCRAGRGRAAAPKSRDPRSGGKREGGAPKSPDAGSRGRAPEFRRISASWPRSDSEEPSPTGPVGVGPTARRPGARRDGGGPLPRVGWFRRSRDKASGLRRASAAMPGITGVRARRLGRGARKRSRCDDAPIRRSGPPHHRTHAACGAEAPS